MTNRAELIASASDKYGFSERANVKLLMAEEGTGSFIANLILDKVKPSYSSDDSVHMLHQGNWPSWAEVGCVVKSRDRYFGSDSVERKFFHKEEHMAVYLENLRTAAVDGDRVVSHEVSIYRWDLGPEYVGSKTLY